MSVEPIEGRKTARVLVAEDDRVARAILSAALEREGYTVECAVDGRETIERIDAQIPDLLLLDVTMPRMSGLEVLHLVRQRFGLLDLPVILTSARSEADDVLAGLHLGANDYVSKPVNFGLLMRRIAAVLGHCRAAKGEMLLQNRLDLTLLALDLRVSLHDSTGRFIQASPSLCTFLGRSEEVLCSLALHDLFHSEDAWGLSAYSEVLPDTYSLVARLDRGDGFAWCELEQQALRDGVTGQLLQVQAIWKDWGGFIPTGEWMPENAAENQPQRRSFAFTPAPVTRVLQARTGEFGPPITQDATSIPWPRRHTAPPLVIPAAEPDDVGTVGAADRVSSPDKSGS